MRKYDLLVTNIVKNTESADPVGTGILISLGKENEALLLTAGHVVKKQDEISWEEYRIIREIDGKRVPLDFQVKNYVLDKEKDLAVALLYTESETIPLNFLMPVERKVIELIGFPGALKQSLSVTKYPFNGAIRTVLQEEFVLEIQQNIETYTNDRKPNIDGISGGGIFYESRDNMIYLVGIEHQVLTREVLYNACNGISSKYIYDFLMNHVQDLGMCEENIYSSISMESFSSIEFMESKLYGKCFSFLSELKLNMPVSDAKKEYKDGVAAHPDHIRYKCNVPRAYWSNILETYFKDRTTVIIRGASGQGKSTLSYDFLMSHYPENKIICINSEISEECVEEIIKAIKNIDVYNECIAYMDVSPNDVSWIVLCKQWNRLDIKTKLLVSVREEDYNRANIDKSSSSIPEIQLHLTKDEAKTIFEKFDDLQFASFDESWTSFGEQGPLMEYIYLLNHSETMKNRLKSQVLNIENSNFEENWIDFLSVIALAGRYDVEVNIANLLQNIPSKDGRFMLRRFESEFFVKIASNGQVLKAVHPVRSKLLFEVLTEELFADWQKSLLELLSIANGNFQFAIVDFILAYGLDNELLINLSKVKYAGVLSYASVLKSLLWYEVYHFRNLNHNVIIEGNKVFNNAYGIVAKADITGMIDDNSIGQDLFLHMNSLKPGIHEKYKELFNKFDPPTLTYEVVDKFLDASKDHIIPLFSYNSFEFTDFSFVLFWMAKRNIILDSTSFLCEKLNFGNNEDLESHLNLLVGLWEQKWQNHFENVRLKIGNRLFQKLGVVSIEYKSNEIYIQSFMETETEVQSHDVELAPNEKCMTIVNAFRRYDPAVQKYNVKLLGMDHLGINVPDIEKHIDSSILYYSWIVQLNATFRKMNEYEVAPDNWKIVLQNVLGIRGKFVKLSKEFLSFMEKLCKKGSASPTKEFITLNSEIRQKVFTTLFTRPKTALDEYGISDDNRVVQKIKNNNALNLSTHRKEGLEKLCRDYFDGIGNFVNNYIELVREFKQGTKRTQPSRIAYYELAKAFHILKDMQKAFDEFFSTFDYEFDNEDEYRTVERLVAITRHMFHNKYYPNRCIGYNTLEEVKHLHRKVDILIKSIPSMSEVQRSNYTNGQLEVTVDVKDLDSFFARLCQDIHGISQDMNAISLDGHCLLEKLDYISLTLAMDGHILFHGLQYSTITFLNNTKPEKIIPSSVSEKVRDLNVELVSIEDVFISLYLLHNDLQQILSLAVSILEAVKYVNKDCVIQPTIERIDKWLCESIMPISKCVQRVIEFSNEIVEKTNKDRYENEKLILDYVNAFSQNPILQSKEGIYLNADTLAIWNDAIQQYESIMSII